MGTLRLYGRYAAASIKGQMQYPASFVLLSIGQFLTTIIEFIGVWALFNRFQSLGDWSLAQVALFYGTVNISFALADMISRGFDIFGPQFVKTGDFDRLLLRPRATALQLLGYELRLTRLGRFLQGALIVGIAMGLLDLSWGLREVVLLLSAIAGGVALFFGLVVLQATLAFWTVESLEVVNTLTFGGVTAAQYPMEIYSKWLRGILHLRRPAVLRRLFSHRWHIGHQRSAGRSRLVSLREPAFRLRVPRHVFDGLASRRAALRVNGELR